MLRAELSELCDLDCIDTYGVEEFHTQPPSMRVALFSCRTIRCLVGQLYP